MDRLSPLWFLPLWLLCASDSGAPPSAFVGDDHVLQCLAPQGQLLVLEWTFTGRHLLFFRSGKILWNQQDKRFRGRVEPADPEMKSLDVTLKNVSLEDSGTYLCEGLVQTSERRQQFTTSVQLTVTERPQEIQAEAQLVQRPTKNQEPAAMNGPSAVTHDGYHGYGLKIGLPLVLVTLVCASVAVYFTRDSMKARLQRKESGPSEAPPRLDHLPHGDSPTLPSPTGSEAPLLFHQV